MKIHLRISTIQLTKRRKMIEEKTTSESIKELIEFMNTIQKEKGNMDY